MSNLESQAQVKAQGVKQGLRGDIAATPIKAVLIAAAIAFAAGVLVGALVI